MTTDVTQPPPPPWEKGTHEDYSSLVIEIAVCRDARGRVFSRHALQDALDHETAMKWPGGGQGEVAFALLVEAVRREALLGLLVALTDDPDFATKIDALDPEEREAKMGELVVNLRSQMDNVVARLARGALEEAVLTVTGD